MGFRCYDRAPILLDSLRANGFLCYPVYLCKVDNVTEIIFKGDIKSHVVIGVWLDGKIELIPTNGKYYNSNRLMENEIDGFKYDYQIHGILNRNFYSLIKY
jgi:hypothetical protein